MPRPYRRTAPHDVFLPQPTAQGIEEFKALYKKHFGEELNPQRALELATRTLHFAYLCMTPAPVSATTKEGGRAASG